jgi:hypothetical protein
VKCLPAGCITTPGVRYLIHALKYVVCSITVYEDILTPVVNIYNKTGMFFNDHNVLDFFFF